MATGAAVAAVAGTAITIAGQRKAAKAQEAAANSNAAQKRLQAMELLDRFEINSQGLKAEGELMKAQQQTSFAGKGIDIGSGSALSVIEETNSLVARQILLDRKEAIFKASQLQRGADTDTRLAGDIRSASRLAQVGTFLSGAGSAAGSLSGGSKS
tara:strand:+ start:4807 stop:5274 length:468 start_codon:yes stop_codon:yes gene_type:complete